MADDKSGTGGQGDGTSAPSAEDLQRELADLKGKYGTLQTERDTHAAKVKQFEDAQKTDAQKQADALAAAEKRAADLEARDKGTRVQLAIERSARKLNLVDEDAAVRLLDHSKIEYDEQGNPKNVEALLQQLVKDKPYLAGAQQQGSAAPGRATNPARGAATGTGTFTKTQIADRAFWNANKPAIMRAMAEGRIVDG